MRRDQQSPSPLQIASAQALIAAVTAQSTSSVCEPARGSHRRLLALGSTPPGLAEFGSL